MHSTTAIDGEDSVSGGEVLVCGFWRLVGQSRRWWVDVADGSRCGSLFFFFFFFPSSLWVVGSVIRGGHGWWSPALVASLASLLAWG